MGMHGTVGFPVVPVGAVGPVLMVAPLPRRIISTPSFAALDVALSTDLGSVLRSKVNPTAARIVAVATTVIRLLTIRSIF